jgi:ribonuclease HI
MYGYVALMNSFYVDGSGWNGERSAWAVILPDGRRVIEETDQKRTNNETEYLAAIRAVDYAQSGDEILTDSQLVEGQVNKGWRINHKHLESLNATLVSRMKANNLTIRWIPRAQNLAGKIFE